MGVVTVVIGNFQREVCLLLRSDGEIHQGISPRVDCTDRYLRGVDRCPGASYFYDDILNCITAGIGYFGINFIFFPCGEGVRFIYERQHREGIIDLNKGPVIQAVRSEET